MLPFTLCQITPDLRPVLAVVLIGGLLAALAFELLRGRLLGGKA